MKKAAKKKATTHIVKCGPCWAWELPTGRTFYDGKCHGYETPLLDCCTVAEAKRVRLPHGKLVRVVGLVVEDVT